MKFKLLEFYYTTLDEDILYIKCSKERETNVLTREIKMFSSTKLSITLRSITLVQTMSMYEFIQQIKKIIFKSLKLKQIFGHLNDLRKNVVNCKVLDHI